VSCRESVSVRPACSEVAEDESGDGGSGERDAGVINNVDVVGVERSALESSALLKVSVSCGCLRSGSCAVVDVDGRCTQLEGRVSSRSRTCWCIVSHAHNASETILDNGL